MIFSASAAQSIGESHFEKLINGYRLTTPDINDEINPLDFQSSPETKTKFIHPKYCSETPQNEIRSAAYCFASLNEVAPRDRGQAISLIQSLADKYGGFVNKYDATDKGLVAIILFGLPKSEGKTLERICNFSLEMTESNRSIAMGISCGSVFAGYTGSGEISEYTALGQPMNLAARLMSKARAGEVLTDTFLWQEMHAQYDFDYLGSLNLKGIALPVRYYHLSRQSKDKAWHQESRFVGRDEEMTSLRGLIDNSLRTKENIIIYVSGDAGIGKSRLVKEALAPYRAGSCHNFFVTCDAILSKPLEAIKQMVRAYFYYNPQLPAEAGIAMFKGLWMGLAMGDTEMLRIESFIASLLGYEWEGSIWSMLPAEEKPKQLKSAFIRFMEQLAKTKSVLIHLDDSQWIDHESQAYLQALSTAEIKPVLIITPCRYLGTGEKVDLQITKHRKADIELSYLSESGSVELIKTILRLEVVPVETSNLIVARAMGNPLFIEQLTSYLMETGSINEKGVITCEIGYLSSFSISDIISSRIDRLTENVRECMLNASVLGMEFNIKVLSLMLKEETVTELEDGVKNRLWKDLDKLRYIFTHILIKDIIYQRILNVKLQKLHQTAAEAMEIVYADRLDENAEEIALHYEKAGLVAKSGEFCNQAGCWFKMNYSFSEAERLLSKAVEIRSNVLGSEHIDTAESLNNLGELFTRIGEHDKALTCLNQALAIRKKNLGICHPDTALTLHNIGGVYDYRCDYDTALEYFEQALSIIREVIGENHQKSARCIHDIGNVQRVKGNYLKALESYDLALSIIIDTLGVDHPSTAICLVNIGETYLAMGNYDNAMDYYQQALSKYKDKPEKPYLTNAYCFRGIGEICTKQELYDEAEQHLGKALAIMQEVLGERHRYVSLCYQSFGKMYLSRGSYSQAIEFFTRDLQLQEEILGSVHLNIAASLIRIGDAYSSQGDYATALEYYIKANGIFTDALQRRHSDYSKSINRLSDTYEKLGNVEQAAKYKALLI